MLVPWGMAAQVAEPAQELTARATELLRQGRATAALYWLDEAERRGAAGVATHYNRGVAHRQLGDVDAAVEAFARARDLAPEAPQVLYGLATALQSANRHAEALPLLQRAILAAPGHLEIRLGLARALAATGRVEEALAAFERVAAGDTAAAEPLYQMGELLLRQGRLEPALRRLSSSARLDSTHVDARLALARGRLLARKPGPAAAALQEAVALAPRNGQACYLLAEAWAELGDSTRQRQALASFQRVSEADQHQRQGVLLARRGETDAALQAWRLAAAADSTFAQPWILMGETHLDRGEVEEAGAAFAAALERRPGWVRAGFGLARAHLLAGRGAAGLEALDHVLQERPDHAEAHHLAARAHARAGRPEAADRHLRRTLQLDPGHVEARQLLDSLAASTRP